MTPGRARGRERERERGRGPGRGRRRAAGLVAAVLAAGGVVAFVVPGGLAGRIAGVVSTEVRDVAASAPAGRSLPAASQTALARPGATLAPAGTAGGPAEGSSSTALAASSGSGTASGPASGTASGLASGTAPAATPTAAASASSSAGACARPAGAAPGVRVTAVRLPVPVVGYGGEGDTEPLPMALAARRDGGSWLAWLGTDKRVHVAGLDCSDRLAGAPFTVAGVDLQDVIADPAGNGGVVLVTRPGTQGSGTLCGGTSSPVYGMWMVRFDGAGKTLWERQVTNLSASLGGYDDGARFVWWYQHHGRLATDGSTFAAYFGVAITVRNGSCVDIHEGDRMQVVSGSGALLSGRDGFAVGCSHAWTSRIAWDPRTKHYAMTCATDNACRIAQPNPYRTVVPGTCDGTLFNGDLVLAKGSGYWAAWSQTGTARLSHFTTGAADRTLTTPAATAHPHLVAYSGSRMLLAWEKGSSMQAQVRDAATGAAVGETFAIGVRDHAYQAFKAYPDGSVAYPAAGANGSTISVARVLPLA